MIIIPVSIVQAEVAPTLSLAFDRTEDLVREAAASGQRYIKTINW